MAFTIASFQAGTKRRREGKGYFLQKPGASRSSNDGTSHVFFDPLELIEKIVAIIPPARANLLRYHGVLAPNSNIRDQIVPKVEKEEGPKAVYLGQQRWAELLKKSFALDILKCSRCGGKMKVLVAIMDSCAIKAILENQGLPTEKPRLYPPRAPPRNEGTSDFEFSQIQPDHDQFS